MCIMSTNEKTYGFSGEIISERFYNNNWGVYVFKTKTQLPHSKPIYGGYEVTISGAMQQLEYGEEYEVHATLTEHKKYGYSYKPSNVIPQTPTTFESQRKFLESIFTQNQANTILEKYPNIVQDVIDGKDDIDFSQLKGITENNWYKLRQKIIENFVIADILVMLSPLGITFNMITKLCNHYDNPHLLKQDIKNNPYVLTKIKGLGFHKIDKLAIKMNPKLINSKQRMMSFVEYFLTEIANSEGHTWVYIDDLKNEIDNFVPESNQYFDTVLREQLDANNKAKVFYVDDERIGKYHYYQMEKNTFDYLYDRNNTKSSINVTEEHIKKGIAQANAFQGFEYDEEQIKIINDIVSGEKGVHVITGYAGASKTTILRGVLNVFKEAGAAISTCALSAKASIVIKESTGFPSSTIHRLLGAKFDGFNFNKENPLRTDVLVLDEASMANVYLFESLIQATTHDTTIIIVGDSGQLPPIGYGNVLKDLIDMNNKDICVVHRLTKIYRQAMDSGVVTDANKIRQGKIPFKLPFKQKIISGKNNDMIYAFFNDNESIHKLAIQSYIKMANNEGVDNVVLAVPRKDTVINSAQKFNNEIQDILLKDEKKMIQVGNKVFKKGAKVMQVSNDYNIGAFNGETGIVSNIESTTENDVVTTIDFGDKTINYTISGNVEKQMGTLFDVELAYAMTVHKCVDEDTLVYTNLGMQKIKDFHNHSSNGEYEDIKEDVYVYNGNKMEHPTKLYNNGIDKCHSIYTKYGYNLNVTQDHHCYYLDVDGHIKMKDGKDICVGDYLILHNNTNIYSSEYVKIPHEECKYDCRTILDYTLPAVIDEDFALFLGMMVADGCIHKNDKMLRYLKRHKECVQKFAYLCKKLFNYDAQVIKDKYCNGWKVEVSSVKIVMFLNQFGSMKANDKYVHKYILQSPKQVQQSFLQGLFEDGSVLLKDGAVDRIELCQSNIDILYVVQQMLLNMGIVSTVSKQYCRLYIYGNNLISYREQIGFISELKNNRLEHIKDSYNDSKTIPYITHVIEKINNRYNLNCDEILSHEIDKRTITRKQLQKYLEYISQFEDVKNDSDVIYLHNFVNKYNIQKVVNIEEVIKQTYCFVMPQSHKFVQNGFDMGNCQGMGVKKVVGVLDTSHYALLDRTIMYTLLTRTKDKCLLISSPKAFKIGVNKSKSNDRQTFLPTFKKRSKTAPIDPKKSIEVVDANSDVNF